MSEDYCYDCGMATRKGSTQCAKCGQIIKLREEVEALKELLKAQPPISDPPSEPGHKLDPMKVIKVIISRPGLYAVLEETFASGRIFHSTNRSLESELERLKNYADRISIVSEEPS